MIYLYQSHNNLIAILKNKLESENIDSQFIDFDFKVLENQSTVIFFQDPYKDSNENYLKTLEKILEACKSSNSRFIYIDTPHLLGLTEYTKVNEDHPHVPYSTIGKIRETAYEILKADKDINKTILRIPDLLGRNSNIFFDNFFNAKSNFLNWSGSTAINHEFIFVDDAVDIIKDFTDKNLPNNFNEYNISGSKYTIEQIAAIINEMFMINIKINHLSAFYLYLRSLSNKDLKNQYENIYLNKKPVFLNSEKYEKEFGEIKKATLEEVLGKLLN